MINKTQKQELVKRAEYHHKMDNIIKGTYWTSEGKGCCVGCLAQCAINVHQELENKFGVPVWLGYLADTLFEGLPAEKNKDFVVRFAKALPQGKSLKLVRPKFLLSTLQNLPKDYKKFPDCKKAIERVIALLIKESKGKVVDNKTWVSARSAAESARSARSAAESARSAAWSAESAAWSAAYVKMADELIRLLEAVK